MRARSSTGWTSGAATYDSGFETHTHTRPAPRCSAQLSRLGLTWQLAAEYTNGSAGTPPCQTCYLSKDHLGNTRLVTDGSANVIARHDFTPFGEEIPAGYAARTKQWGAFDGVRQKFTGQEHDEENQFDFFQARYLSAAQQRFLSPDPGNAGADPFNPQSWNAYAYVLNNPLNAIDPFGLWNWNLGNCYFNTVASYVDGEFQGYDTQFVGCFNFSGGYDRLASSGSQQPPPPPQSPQRTEPPQRTQIDCSQPPPMPPGPEFVDISTNMQDTERKGFLWWLNQVRPTGAWDFKANYNNQGYKAFGNFNYGATCNALGLGLEGCQRGAGAAAIATSITSVLAGKRATNGPGDPLGSLQYPGGRAANDNGMSVYGDQTGGFENQSVIAGWGYAAWKKACRQ